jgi:hypothetical protein
MKHGSLLQEEERRGKPLSPKQLHLHKMAVNKMAVNKFQI